MKNRSKIVVVTCDWRERRSSCWTPPTFERSRTFSLFPTKQKFSSDSQDPPCFPEFPRSGINQIKYYNMFFFLQIKDQWFRYCKFCLKALNNLKFKTNLMERNHSKTCLLKSITLTEHVFTS